MQSNYVTAFKAATNGFDEVTSSKLNEFVIQLHTLYTKLKRNLPADFLTDLRHLFIYRQINTIKAVMNIASSGPSKYDGIVKP